MTTPELTNIVDLEQKTQSVIAFISDACSREKYGDHLQFFIDSRHTSPNKSLVVYWSCTAFSMLSCNKTYEKDGRLHEQLLQHYFKAFDLTITKSWSRWELIISTAQSNQVVHCIVTRKL